MSERGHFIVVEGLEGAGKTTAMATVQQCLSDHQCRFITTREPGGTQVGEAIRQFIKHAPPDEPLSARTELLLLYSARVQLVECVIKPALRRGEWVLADRFELSTFAYQGGGRGLDMAWIEQLSAFCLQGFSPDLTLFLNVTPATGLQRVKSRGMTDRIEGESLAFFTAVQNAYQTKINTLKNVIMIDANEPVGTVQQAIRDALSVYLNNARISA